jgi:hypothetical protein
MILRKGKGQGGTPIVALEVSGTFKGNWTEFTTAVGDLVGKYGLTLEVHDPNPKKKAS